MICLKFQPNVSSASGEKNDFSGLAFFSNSRHFLIVDKAGFVILEPCSLVMLHEIFEKHRRNGFKE